MPDMFFMLTEPRIWEINRPSVSDELYKARLRFSVDIAPYPMPYMYPTDFDQRIRRFVRSKLPESSIAVMQRLRIKKNGRGRVAKQYRRLEKALLDLLPV